MLAVARLVVVCVWSVAGQHAFTENVWVEIGLSILSYLVLVAVLGATVSYFGRRLSNQLRYENIITAATTYAVSTLALMLLAAIVPHQLVGDRPATVLTAISSHVVAIGVYTVSIGLAAFLTVVKLQRQHRGTRALLFVQAMTVLGIWLCFVLTDLSPAFGWVAFVLLMVGGLVTLLNVRRLHWLSTITLERKVRLLWLCTCGAFASFVLALTLASFDDVFVTQSARMFLRSGAVVPAVINFFGFLFFVRLFFATLAALPNSAIVDRRSSEVEALAGLTRLVAQSVRVDDLLNSVTRYSLSVCRAHGAWCEMYDAEELRVVGEQLVTKEYVHHLHTETQIDELLRNGSEPLHVESMSEVVQNPTAPLAIRSLISIPILSNGQHAGSLVMFSTLEYGFEQDDVRLLSAFGDTISVGIDQARLVETEMERERLQQEFDVARSIQLSLLPRESPTNSGWQIDAVMIPATQVGGDYYDFVQFASGNSGAIIADVAGKGVPAAFYMATLKGVVLAQMVNSAGPADLLRRINATLYGRMERRAYISMTCAEFDPHANVIRIARAGHTPALVRTAERVHSLLPRGLAIGIVPSVIFDAMIEEVSVAVQPGDVCLLTTDGVTERRNPSETEMTVAPLVDMLSAVDGFTSAEIVQATLSHTERHGGGTEQHDDITIVAARISEPRVTEAPSHRTPPLAGVAL
jgi:serine phosphatase RsbU (regulator of sigma subunit)